MTGKEHTTVESKSGSGDDKHPLAETHLSASNGGHWWNQYGADSPDWYRDSLPTIKLVSDGDALRSEVAPDPPDTVEWDQYVAYNCVICRDNCINRRDSEAGEKRQCWSCVSVPE